METKTLVNELLSCFKKNKKNSYSIKLDNPVIDFFYLHLYNFTEDCFGILNQNAIYLCLKTYEENNGEKNSKKIPITNWFNGVANDKGMEEISWKEFKHLYKHVVEIINLTSKQYRYINEETIEIFDFQRASRCSQAIRPEFEFRIPDNLTFEELKEGCINYMLKEDFSEFDFIQFILENYTNMETIEAILPDGSRDKETRICTDTVLLLFEEELADYSEELFTKLKYDPNVSDEEIVEMILEGWQDSEYWIQLKSSSHIEGGKLYRPITSEYFERAKNYLEKEKTKQKHNAELNEKLNELEKIFNRA